MKFLLTRTTLFKKLLNTVAFLCRLTVTIYCIKNNSIFKLNFFQTGTRNNVDNNNSGPIDKIFHATLVDRAMPGTPMYLHFTHVLLQFQLIFVLI